jgi:two-component system nitrogen regulation sensor histidine kinase NtrY
VFSSRIIFPIRRLVEATDKAKEGDLTVQVPEQDLYEDEIRVLSVAFNRMIKQIYKQQNDLLIAQSALAWSDVARRVAHEIKNPLTPIQLASSRLWSKFSREVSDQGSFKKYIDIIDRHANDIKKIVAEFVNFARLPLPTFEKCNLVSVIKDAVEARRLINEGISYIFDTVSENIEFVCDVTQLHQVMINLLKNAEESGDTISSKLEIIITVRQVEDEMIIQVKDNGPGFPKDLINQVIEPYVSTRSKGMGLGLAIVKKILSDHYGNIKLENNPQGGAMITLSFDLIKLQRSC